jgi:superfamily II DNA/RNA helicase
VDLTEKLIFPEKLEFFKAIVSEDDKLLYLYNFLNEHQGETFIIFLNSITYGKKVHSMLKVLGVSIALEIPFQIESVQLHSS